MKVPTPRKLSSGTWFIQLRLGGESISVSARTKKECVRQAQYIKAEYMAGKRAAPPKEPEMEKSPTLGEAIDAYIKNRDAVLSPSTIRGYKIIRRTRFKSMMDKPLSDISDEEWQRACNNEARICSAKTLQNAWGLIAPSIAGKIGKAPKVTLPQVMPNERPYLEPEEIMPFIAAVKGTDVEIPALLALSSLRRSEIMGLNWKNVDLEKKLIRVKGSMVYNQDNKLTTKKENKTRPSARTVPIMIDELYQALSSAKNDSGRVTHLAPNTIQRKINKICEENGLPKVGIHGLRHSFASLAYHLRVPIKIVMSIGGWSDYQTLRKIYTHIAKSDVSHYTEQFIDFFQISKMVSVFSIANYQEKTLTIFLMS